MAEPLPSFDYQVRRLGRMIAVGSEWLIADLSRTAKRARGIGRRSGWSLYVGFAFKGSDGLLHPSRFGKVVPTADATLAPLIARACLDAAAEIHKLGLTLPRHWEIADLEPPSDE